MQKCEYCEDEFIDAKLHQKLFCLVLHRKPSDPCKRGCMGFHLHRMLDGKWAVFFDDMPNVTVDTEEQALREMRKLTHPEGDPR